MHALCYTVKVCIASCISVCTSVVLVGSRIGTQFLVMCDARTVNTTDFAGL
jgi:hypothetical protein